jgi:hypothetical protein
VANAESRRVIPAAFLLAADLAQQLLHRLELLLAVPGDGRIRCV